MGYLGHITRVLFYKIWSMCGLTRQGFLEACSFFFGGGVSPPRKLNTPPQKILSRLYVDNDLQQSAPHPPNVPDSPPKSENLQEALLGCHIMYISHK